MKTYPLVSLILVAAAATNAAARSGVNVDINLGVPVVVQPAPPPPPVPVYSAPAPPAISVEEAPQFIFSPALGFYVAVGIPYDLVYTGSDYFYFYGGRWFRSNYYNGPWVIAGPRHFPPLLHRYPVDRIRYYRDFEFRRYNHDRAHFDGRFHRPEFRGKRREEHRERFHERH